MPLKAQETYKEGSGGSESYPTHKVPSQGYKTSKQLLRRGDSTVDLPSSPTQGSIDADFKSCHLRCGVLFSHTA